MFHNKYGRRSWRLAFLLVICVFFKVDADTAFASDDCDRGFAAFSKGRFGVSNRDDAIPHYLEAIDLCPGFIRPYELVGNWYREKGDKDRAIDYFTKAAELGTANHKLYYLLAELLFEKGDLNGVSKNLNKALSIRGDYREALELKAKSGEAVDTDGPEIMLYEPATRRGVRVVLKDANLTVRGLATDKSGISWVRINGVEAVLDEQGNFLKDIPIQMETNTVTVEAADRLDNRSRISVTVEGEKYALPAPSAAGAVKQPGALYGKSFAVVIGVNGYEKWPALEFGVADAEAVKLKLEENGFDYITLILDKQATQRRILTELFDVLPKKVGHADRLVFFFAGHGQTEDLPDGRKRGYIIPVDGDTSDYGSTAISMEQIRSLSSHISAKHILYVMDSCYSGLGLSRSLGVSPKLSDYLRKVGSMRVVQIITAGAQGEQVQESEGHGLFTAYFLKALDGEADFDKDGVVTGTELGAYLRPTVSNASRQAQTPLSGRLEGEGEFLFFVLKREE